MANSLDAGGQARGALRQVLTEAPDALANATQLSNMLKDFMPNAPREAGVLVTAVEAGAADLLRDKAPQVGGQAAAVQVAGMLEERTGLSQSACQWAVTELAIATGLIPDGPTQLAGPVPQPTADQHTRTAGPWGQQPAGGGQFGQPATAPGQFGQPAAGPGQFGQPQAYGQPPAGPGQQAGYGQPAGIGQQPGQAAQAAQAAFGPGQAAGQSPYAQAPPGAYSPPVTAPGAYGQGAVAQPYGQGLYGQGVTAPGAYGQRASQVPARPGTSETGALAVVAGVFSILAALFVTWYAIAQPAVTGLGPSLLYAGWGLALTIGGLMALISGTARRLGAGIAFGANAVVAGEFVIQASFIVHDNYHETAIEASSVLLALVSVCAVLSAGIYLLRAAGLGGIGGLGVGWLVAAVLYVIAWIPNWTVYPGQAGGTAYSYTTGTEKFFVTVGLLLTIAPLVLGGLMKQRSGPFRAAMAIGWLIVSAVEQFSSLPGLEYPGYHVTKWLWFAWLVWFAVVCLIVASAIRERSAGTAPAQQPAS